MGRAPTGLWNRVIYDAFSGCWNWNGNRTSAGYGRGRYKGKKILAHRLAAILWLKMDENDSRRVLHRCDNPSCFNPRHLFFGTNSENQKDSVSKGRHMSIRKTHCPQGHAYSPENTYIQSSASGGRNRICRICKAEQRRLRRWEEKQEQK